MGQPIMTTHNFSDSLEKSKEDSCKSWWLDIYRQAFPDFCAMEYVELKEEQIKGTDRVITLTNGKKILVEEKVRAKKWGDILLEVRSNYEKKIPGWIEKPLYCDYLVYVFEETREAYMFPAQQLRAAWKKHRNEWIMKYDPKEADNGSYTTVSVPVPTDVLLSSLTETAHIQWKGLGQ